MRVCFFGIYDSDYPRNRVLIKGLKENGVEVVEARVDPKTSKGFERIAALARVALAARAEPLDFVVVAFPGHAAMLLAKLLFREKIVFDAFVSLYDSNVLDRKTHKPLSLKAAADWLLDWLAPRLAHRVLMDTQAHVDFYSRAYHVPREKFVCVYVGTDPEIFYPQEAPLPEVFTLHFHGSHIPLQGIGYILEAAKLLENEPIRFRILGSGQESERIRALAEKLDSKNIEFVQKVPLEQLPEYIAASHACLGIFGDTPKTARVIPNKVFEYAAMGRAIITADTPAIREVFEDGKNILLCEAANPESLAGAIRRLASDQHLRETLGRNAKASYESSYKPKFIAGKLLQEL